MHSNQKPLTRARAHTFRNTQKNPSFFRTTLNSSGLVLCVYGSGLSKLINLESTVLLFFRIHFQTSHQLLTRVTKIRTNWWVSSKILWPVSINLSEGRIHQAVSVKTMHPKVVIASVGEKQSCMHLNHSTVQFFDHFSVLGLRFHHFTAGDCGFSIAPLRVNDDGPSGVITCQVPQRQRLKRAKRKRQNKEENTPTRTNAHTHAYTFRIFEQLYTHTHKHNTHAHTHTHTSMRQTCVNPSAPLSMRCVLRELHSFAVKHNNHFMDPGPILHAYQTCSRACMADH